MAGRKYTNMKYEADESPDSYDTFAVLTKDSLEDAIGTGMPKKDLLIIFRKSAKEMDEWCKKNYHNMNFDDVYLWTLKVARQEYIKAMISLGKRGNPSAMQIATKYLMDTDELTSNRVVFVNDIPKDGTN